MGNESARGIEPGRLAFLLDKGRGVGYLGRVRRIEHGSFDSESGNYHGRLVMDGVKISGVLDEVEPIRQPPSGCLTSPDDIPVDGWDYVYSEEPKRLDPFGKKLREGGNGRFADILSERPLG